MKISKILCPLDFSDHSEQALYYAASMARSQGAKLILLHVIEQLHGFDQYLILTLTAEEIAERLEKDANERINELLNKIKNGLDIETEIRSGKAFVEIIKKAQEDDVDLIVIGSHGRTGLSQVLIGSVAEKVARKAHCPVLIVKDKNAKFIMP